MEQFIKTETVGMSVQDSPAVRDKPTFLTWSKGHSVQRRFWRHPDEREEIQPQELLVVIQTVIPSFN